MTDLLQTLGLDQRFQQTMDALQARVGAWLAIPAQVRRWQAAALPQATQDQVTQLAADYASTRALVERGLALLQQLQASRSLPSLDQVPTIVSTGAAVLATTDAARQIDAAAAGVLPATSSRGATVAKVTGAIAGIWVAWKLYQLARRRARRRR